MASKCDNSQKHYFDAMSTLPDISNVLRQALAQRDLTQAQLRQQAGVSQRTLTNVLSGAEDFKVSTLLALADRLGLNLLLVPKGAASAVQAGDTTDLAVKSRVQAALDRAASSPRESQESQP